MKGRPLKQKNPDLRRQVQMPCPEIEVLEKSLHDLIRMGDFQPIRNSLQIPAKIRRYRLLTLPVMVAVVLSLVYRKIPGLAEASRVIWTDGLMFFYAVINDLCSEVAIAMNKPLERISLEMVFRGLS
jgi:hypothetical protein